MDAAECLVCERIRQIVAGTNATFIAEVRAGYVVLGDYQYLKGYSVLLSRDHVEHLHDLDPTDRGPFLDDMATLGGAMWRALKPQRLNYMIAGGLVPHLHAHVFPRYVDEPAAYREGPVGGYPKTIREAPDNALDPLRHRALIEAIGTELRGVRVR